MHGTGAVASCEMGDRDDHEGYVIIEQSQENLAVPSLPNPRMVCLHLYSNTCVVRLIVTSSLLSNPEL